METQKCLYEILGVEATASNEEIRSAYRKLALKWHPDKIQQTGASAEECQEATIHFQEIGRAYEVLADPSERSWYDSHRSQILSSSSSSPSDFDFNPWPFFSPSVFAGYGDTGKGFYAVYGELFKKLHHQEVSFANACGLRTPLYPPDMGNLATAYPQVQKFYNHWLGFSTVKDFAWCDEYKVSSGPNRKIRRLMEEENKKIRSKARKEFNEAICHLAAFVRKRDKRVLERQIEVQRLEKEKEEMRNARRKKEEEEKRMKARLYEEAEWTKIESEPDADDGSDFDESMGSYAWRQSKLKSNEAKKGRQDEFYCIVCNKNFKSDEQWRNHERSKKHLEKVAILKESFEEEDEEFEAISHGAIRDDDADLEMKASISKGEESPSISDIELLSADIREIRKETTSTTDNASVQCGVERASAGSSQDNRGDGSALSTERESDDADREEDDGEDDEFDSLLTMVNSYASRHRQSTSEKHDAAEQSALGQDPSQEEGELGEGEEEETLPTRWKSGQTQEAYESSEDLEKSLMNGETPVIPGNESGELDGEISGASKKKKSRGRLRNKKQQVANLNRHSKIAEELLYEKNLDVMMQTFEGLDADEKEPCSSQQAEQKDSVISGKDGSSINKGQQFEKRHSREYLSSKGKNPNGHLLTDLEQPRRPARGKKSKVNTQSAILTCETCGEDFDSRNQLFKHVSATKHAILKGK
ncbi:hypothetical protein GOP47_0002383 [Adiantum capillus-veneris]|uniref:Uncharacterized protein n=1 Tax=Adiantum capillus-veneris TaxID=13818 RepID=A0A9D4VAU5_ADICA|nr:hypothetical protein GOP47_0002383 [Adiantum capillus-veneris]